MNINGPLYSIDKIAKKYTSIQIIFLAVLGVAIIGIPDYLLGTEISLSIFYFIPVGITAWYAGRFAGGLMGLISTLPIFIGEWSAGFFFRHPWIILWNVLLHLGTMLVFVFLLERLRCHLEHERALARTDPVTGIFNRRGFMEHLQYNIDLMAREGGPIALAYIDLDDFKQINDRRGHDVGDKVLRDIASSLTSSVRKTDVVGRLGGDEFALLIAGADRVKAENCINKIRESFNIVLGSGQHAITCSIGCVTCVSPVSSMDSVIRAADLLMYRVKSGGKNGVAFEDFA
jgi:diguanylate cyclase (GGDEF)-like protein